MMGPWTRTTLRTSYAIFAPFDGELVEVSPQSKAPLEIKEENHFETPGGLLCRDGREDWLIAHGNNGDVA